SYQPGEGGPCESGQFQGLPYTLDCLLSELNEVPCRTESLTSPLNILYANGVPSKMKVLISKESETQQSGIFI
ncbi:hypothetical protein ACQP3J_33945, partial [Escherichia coli]